MFLPVIGVEVGGVVSIVTWAAHLFGHAHQWAGPAAVAANVAANHLAAHAVYATDRVADFDEGQRKTPELDAFIGENRDAVAGTAGAAALAWLAYQALRGDPLRSVAFVEIMARYRDFKKRFPLLKPYLVGGSMTFLTESGMGATERVSCALVLSAASSLADIRDVDADEAVGVRTLPVVTGRGPAAGVAVAQVLAALAILVVT